MSIDLSLVLACYNEEPWLEQSVRDITRVLDGSRLKYEIIFVDDASKDQTPVIIRNIIDKSSGGSFRAIYHDRNTGRGRAVSDGMRVALGDMVGYIDVDLEVNPQYIVSCCAAIREGSDVAVGLRTFKFVRGGLLRRFLSRGYAALVRILLPIGMGIDTESGCKFFTRKTIVPVLDKVRDSGWFWDTEVMVICRLAGYSIANVPCLYIRNTAKPSSVRLFRDIFTSLVRLIEFRIRLTTEAFDLRHGDIR